MEDNIAKLSLKDATTNHKPTGETIDKFDIQLKWINNTEPNTHRSAQQSRTDENAIHEGSQLSPSIAAAIKYVQLLLTQTIDWPNNLFTHN